MVGEAGVSRNANCLRGFSNRRLEEFRHCGNDGTTDTEGRGGHLQLICVSGYVRMGEGVQTIAGGGMKLGK